MDAQLSDEAKPDRKPAGFIRSAPLVVLIAGSFILFLFFIAVFGSWIAPMDYAAQSLGDRLLPPAFWGGDSKYLLGTDALGRDILSRLIFAIRISLVVAFLGTAIGAILGTFLGIVAAHFRGIVEHVIMAFVDAQAALPFLIVALTLLAFFGNSFWLFVALMGIYGWENYARLTRGMVLSAKEQGYAAAVNSLGARPARLYFRHILPNIGGVLITQFSLNFPQSLLAETSLSFLGLGIQPPLTSLGQMLGSGRDHLVLAWWIAVVPGVVIFLSALAISLFGDSVRDRFDPALRER